MYAELLVIRAEIKQSSGDDTLTASTRNNNDEVILPPNISDSWWNNALDSEKILATDVIVYDY
jgi:hypothetical protein